jgi:V/A-type H+/Na+-transporting ATPase subunit E
VGYPALLEVLEEEASREARDVRAAAEQEATRIVEDAREAARKAREALLARERASLDARARADREALARDLERTLLAERRRHLERMREEALHGLPAAGSPELDAQFLADVLPEIEDGPVEVAVDPGAEDAVRAALQRLAPDVAARTRVVAAPARRGGIEVLTGRRVLDDTLPARLERAWPDVEAELASVLFGEG